MAANLLKLTRHLTTRSIPTQVLLRRQESWFTKYREPANGILFHEPIPKPGEKREWSKHEKLLMGCYIATFVAWAGYTHFKPKDQIEHRWLRKEALIRVAENDEREAAEEAAALAAKSVAAAAVAK